MHLGNYVEKIYQYVSYKGALNLLLFSSINTLIIMLLDVRQPIWPQVDNLAGVLTIGKGSSSDFYTESLIHSPRILTIALIKGMSILLNLGVIMTLALLSAAVGVFGAPLFLTAIRKSTMSKVSECNRFLEILTISVFFLLLNSTFLHKLEVNGFFINPFTQGATTANLATLIFLAGVISRYHKIRIALFVMSIATHLTTGIFLLIIFKSLLPRMRFPGHKKFKITFIVGITSASICLLTMINTRKDLSAWSFYIHERASNHFVLTINNPLLFQITIWASLLVTLVIGKNYDSVKLIPIIYVLIGVAITFSAYPMYGLPFGLAAIGIMVTKGIKEFNFLIQTLLILLALQAFPISEISIFFSLFLPASRFFSLVSLFIMGKIVVGILDGTNSRLEKYSIKRRDSLRVILTITISIPVLLIGIVFTNSSIKSDLLKSSETTEKFFDAENLTSIEILPIGIDTVGWREFGKARIYVDDYTFWSNLHEYMLRSRLKNQVKEIIETNGISTESIKLVKEKFIDQKNMTLIIEYRESPNAGKLPCIKRENYLICHLGPIK